MCFDFFFHIFFKNYSSYLCLYFLCFSVQSLSSKYCWCTGNWYVVMWQVLKLSKWSSVRVQKKCTETVNKKAWIHANIYLLVLGIHSTSKSVLGSSVDEIQNVLVLIIRVHVHRQYWSEDFLENNMMRLSIRIVSMSIIT